ncbi:MAG: hypothetical protein ACFFED_12520 [Candidatus Thorarchaeota archaeon]
MNRLSHLTFAFSLFVALYSLIFAFSVWQSDLGQLTEFLLYYIVGGIAFMIIVTPLLYWKAPNKDSASRTVTNRGAAFAVAYVVFAIGSLAGSIIYLWYHGIPFIGHVSLFIGAFITMSGALMPDWDIIFLGISEHRHVVFHSVILPLLITLLTLVNVANAIISTTSFSIGAHVEYYLAALFLLGYASHLYLDIFPSDASPLEILWRVVDPSDKAPTGLKPWGPITISKKAAKSWLVGNASLLVMVAVGLMALYFYNLQLAP